ncbi:MAPRE2 family protein [Megaselia abdita]
MLKNKKEIKSEKETTVDKVIKKEKDIKIQPKVKTEKTTKSVKKEKSDKIKYDKKPKTVKKTKSEKKPTVEDEKYFSHRDYVKWANENSKCSHYKIEQLSSGVAYCQILNRISPSNLPESKIKVNPTKELDAIHNLKLLQTALHKMKIEKEIPIDRIIKARYKDNYEFAQWFKSFYDYLFKEGLAKVKTEKAELPKFKALEHLKQLQQEIGSIKIKRENLLSLSRELQLESERDI